MYDMMLGNYHHLEDNDKMADDDKSQFGGALNTLLQITEKSGNLTLRRLMSYIYGAPILDVSRSHTTTQHSR